MILALILTNATVTRITAQPVPGNLFREYCFANSYGDAGGAIRVGGKRGVSYPDRGSDFDYVNAWIDFPHAVDLDQAVRAEIVVEKILSHNGTDGLAIQWNESDWLQLAAPATLPKPSRDYYHHTCITIPMPLEHIHGDEADTNRFRLRVSPEHGWNWPQHLIYGVHLRLYYDADTKRHVTGTVSSPVSDAEIGMSVPLHVAIPERVRRVNRVDFLALYKDVNWEGDGVYRQWHHFYYHGNLCHHLGSSVVEPFRNSWDTSWVPDQEQPIEIAARITDDTNLTWLTTAVTGLTLKRPGHSVELCRPVDVPRNWVTRNAAFEQKITMIGQPDDAIAARLCWSSWSPGYMNGLYFNGTKILDTEGPRYRYFDHRVALPDLSLLQHGTNVIGTGKTPRHEGKMVHGMEVNWPGIQLLVQYRDR